MHQKQKHYRCMAVINTGQCYLFFYYPCKILSVLKEQLLPLGELYLVLGVCALQGVLSVGFSGAAWQLLVLWDLGRSLSCFALLGPEFLPLGPGGQRLAGAANRRGQGQCYDSSGTMLTKSQQVSAGFTQLHLRLLKTKCNLVCFTVIPAKEIKIPCLKELQLACLINAQTYPEVFCW